jgi:hypothetical protein
VEINASLTPLIPKIVAALRAMTGLFLRMNLE